MQTTDSRLRNSLGSNLTFWVSNDGKINNDLQARCQTINEDPSKHYELAGYHKVFTSLKRTCPKQASIALRWAVSTPSHIAPVHH